MATNSGSGIESQAFVLPAALIAGTTFSAAESEECSRICNASTGETIGWQEHASAELVDRAVHAAHDA
ncbi:MAG TPA: aldehyde dehydrogenase, partial [Paraburkholderia sp.]